MEYGVSASSVTGITDNPSAQATGAQTHADGFETAQGRVYIGLAGPLALNSVAYSIMATTWFRGTQGSSLTHTLRLASDVRAWPNLRLTLGGEATLAQLSTLDTNASADSQMIGPRPAGNQEFVSVQAGQALLWQLGGSWSVAQLLQGRLYRTIHSAVGTTTNRAVELDAELHHQWQQDAAGLRGRVGLTRSTVAAQNAGPSAPASEFAELTSTWRHDWTSEVAHDLAAGVFVLHTDRSRPLPGGSAGLSWRGIGREIEIRTGQTADYNIYVGTAYQRRFASVRLGLLVNRSETLRLHTDGNIERDSTTTGAGIHGSADVYSVRCSLRWQPGDTFVYGLEYTFRDQRASAAESGISPFASFRRQAAMVTIEARYPTGT